MPKLPAPLAPNTQWEEQFKALARYKRLHGDCNVPADGAEHHKALADWVKATRAGFETLTPDAQEKLIGLGFRPKA